MSDYYIRTPDNEASRGPFDISKLQTLAEAGQITENTLFYDETKEEWIPIALNEALKASVFPERKRLSLKAAEEASDVSHVDDEADPENSNRLDVESMLAAAEGQTEETKHLKQKAQSFDKAVSLASSGIGLLFILSAACLIFPHYAIVKEFITEETYSMVLNYPFFVLGIFDLLMALFLFLAITEIYPLLRTRAMLTTGFGIYVGWSIGDPILMGTTALAGIGIFAATLAQTYSSMVVAIILGLAGNGYLAYLSLTGRFNGFFDITNLNLIQGS